MRDDRLGDWLTVALLILAVIGWLIVPKSGASTPDVAADTVPGVVEMELPGATGGIRYRKIPNFERSGCVVYLFYEIDPAAFDDTDEWRPFEAALMKCEQ